MIWRINSFLGVSRLKITEKLKALFLFDNLRPNYFVFSPTNHFFLSWRLCDLEIIHGVIWRQYLLTAPAAKKTLITWSAFVAEDRLLSFGAVLARRVTYLQEKEWGL